MVHTKSWGYPAMKKDDGQDNGSSAADGMAPLLPADEPEACTIPDPPCRETTRSIL